MGKQRQPSFSKTLLCLRVKNIYGSSIPPVNEVMDALRAKHPEYRRAKPQKFTRFLKENLDFDNDKRKRKFNADNDDGNPENKKAKQVDTREDTESSGEADMSAVSTSNSVKYDMESNIDVKASKKQKNMEIEFVADDMQTKKVDKLMDHKAVKASKERNPDNLFKGKDNEPRLTDFGGMDAVLDELRMEVILPMLEPELLDILGTEPVSGILLHGPPGCGKTRLARAIANEAGVPLYKVSATELVSGISGGSEENIRELFAKAYRTAPSIVFIDEIDVIASKRENLQREMEKRIVTQLMTCMDSTEMTDGNSGHVLVIGATNRPDALDPAIRRPGRLDREISLNVPDENTRAEILSVVTRNKKIQGDIDLFKIAKLTPGFVGADLVNMLNKAGLLALKNTVYARKLDTERNERAGWSSKEKDELSITESEIKEAIKLSQPSLKREGFSSIPDVKWEDVGGLDSLRTEFKRIVRGIKHSKGFEGNGIPSNTSFLIFGPHGCGKTLIAKAVANEAGANFIHVKGPELMNKFVGETEKAVRTIFSKARTCAPCIIFFDEVDALTTQRGNEGAWVVERTLMQLMLELDGGDQRKGVYVIGATNRPEVIDPALLRPGRLGTHLYAPIPNQDERGLILKALSRNKHLDAEVDLIAIARSEACANFSGADLSKLLNEAALLAFEEQISINEANAHGGESDSSSQSFVPAYIKNVHIEQAVRKIKPSVSNEERHNYDLMAKRLGAF